MEIKEIVQTLRKKGRIGLKEGQGMIIELVVPEKWEENHDKQDGIFLISDLFQIRIFALPFSEVSLDIVELATKSIIYHTTANEVIKNAPIIDRVVKFALIKEGFWNQVLYNFGRPLIFQVPDFQGEVENHVGIKFPLLTGVVKEMFLGPEGEVKILNG